MERSGKLANEHSTLREAFRPPSVDDPSHPLIVQHDDQYDAKPAFDVTFSFVKWLRVLTLAFLISMLSVMSAMTGEATCALFITWTALAVIWNVGKVLQSLAAVGRVTKRMHGFELSLGGLSISYGKPAEHTFSNPNKRSFVGNLVDLLFAVFMFITGPVTLHSDYMWHYRAPKPIAGLSITIGIFMTALAFLDLFSIFRSVNLRAYRVEDEKNGYREVRLPSVDLERGNHISVSA